MIKSCLKLIFLALLFSQPIGSIILTDDNLSSAQRWLVLNEQVMGKIKSMIDAASPTTVVYYDPNKCDAYNPKDEITRIQVCVKSSSDTDNSINLEFRNPNNKFELSFSNINIQDEASDIKIDPYVDEFIKSLNDLVFDPALKKTSIQKGITDGAAAAGASDVRVDDSKITFKYQDKENVINYSIKGDMLEFSTDFFQDSIDLNIPLKKFIEFETKKLVADVIEHLHLMQQFALSDGETAAQSIKTLSCESIMANANIIPKFTEKLSKDAIQVTVSGTSVSIQKDGKAVDVGCTLITVGDFSLVELKADFKSVSSQINPVTQTFLTKSLYNLLPVVQSFFNDLATFITRILSDTNNGENFEPTEDIA